MPLQQRLRPTFLIIGAQKSGTTALYKYLSHHPNVVAPDIKEMSFFLCPLLYASGLEYYHSCFPEKNSISSHQITFEAGVHYLTSAEAAKRIYDYNPKMKLIALLRDPVLRAYSAWQMYRSFFRDNRDWYFEWMERCESPFDRDAYIRRPSSFGSCFRKAVLAELEPNDRGDLIEAPFLRHGFYEQQLRAYLKFFPPEQMLIECSDRFRDHTRDALGEIEDFLGIDRHTWPEDVIRPVYVLSQTKYSQEERNYTHLPPQGDIELLKEVYDEPNQRLYTLLGREFQWL